MKTLNTFVLQIAVVLLIGINSATAQQRYQPNWTSLSNYQVPDWFRDAKFGIFIHWGVYSVPAFSSEWYPRNMYQQGSPEYKHQVETYGPENKIGYKDFIPQFKAEKFDADKWAELFKKAGAKYVVPWQSTMTALPCTIRLCLNGMPRIWGRGEMWLANYR